MNKLRYTCNVCDFNEWHVSDDGANHHHKLLNQKAQCKGVLRYHMPDLVNQPPHYTSGSVECIDAIQAALTEEEFRGFCKGNSLKYIWRCNLKGKEEDLKKAQWYLRRLTDGKGQTKDSGS